MESKRLPINKSKISMDFASLEFQEAYNQERNGALVNFSNFYGHGPVNGHLLKEKIKAGISALLGLKRYFSSRQGFSLYRFNRKGKAEFQDTGFPASLSRKSLRQTLAKFFRHAGRFFFSGGEKSQQENFQRIKFLDKKGCEEAFRLYPFRSQPYSVCLQDNSILTRQENQPSVCWQEAEELAKTGFWEFNVQTQKFMCTHNALRLVSNKPHQEETDFMSLISNFNEADKIYLAENWNHLIGQAQELDYNARITDLFGDKWIKIKGKAIWEKSTIIKIIGYFQDITESKVLEQLLREARETAEKEMKAKSDFVSMISHEIRTPLNSISGFTYLLLQDDVQREEQKDYLQSIQFSTQNLLTLINETLDYSKIEAGKVEFEHISFKFHDLLEDIHRSFFLRAAEKKVNIYLDINPGTPDVAVGDPSKLCQILNNLISNAIKFTQEGHVKISVDVVYESESDWVFEFAVSDTGVGIPEDKQPLIFESFIQANASTNRQFGGTGLGLAITKKLIELQNGSIHLNSVPGEGSEFIVRLKLAKPDPAQSATHRSDINLNQYGGLRGAKILVVDDNVLNRNVACKLLTNWQVKVDTAENGLEALKKVKSIPYDIILMDLFMPEMDGFEAITQIKGYGIKTPIIALTGSAMTEEENKVMDLGVHDYVTKPFNPEELYKTILEHLILIEV